MAGPCGDARNDRAVPLQFTPGSACSYSNSNYFVLGSVIEAVTSGSYSDNLLLHVLRAAGLGSTFYQPPAGAQPSLRPDGEWAHADDGAIPLPLGSSRPVRFGRMFRTWRHGMPHCATGRSSCVALRAHGHLVRGCYSGKFIFLRSALKRGSPCRRSSSKSTLTSDSPPSRCL